MDNKEVINRRSFTPTEVANLLGMKTSSIYALISRHELAALKSGRRRAITQAQLNAYLQNRRNTDHVIDYTKKGIDLVNR